MVNKFEAQHIFGRFFWGKNLSSHLDQDKKTVKCNRHFQGSPFDFKKLSGNSTIDCLDGYLIMTFENQFVR